MTLWFCYIAKSDYTLLAADGAAAAAQQQFTGELTIFGSYTSTTAERSTRSQSPPDRITPMINGLL